MNYKIILSGSRFTVYDDCVKLIMLSAIHSDYVTNMRSYKRSTPFSPYYNEILITGSLKKTYKSIIVNFDEFIDASHEKVMEISPSALELDNSIGSLHYWGVAGALFKIIGDLSTAYVTGYLLEKNMKKELDNFTKFSNQLPFALQVAVNELMTDAD